MLRGVRRLIGRVARRRPVVPRPDPLPEVVLKPLGGGAAVVVLAPPGSPLPDQVRAAHPQATVVEGRGSASTRHVRLTAQGPFDLIVDEESPDGRRTRFLNTFFHLKPGATLVMLGAADELLEQSEGSLGELLAEAALLRGQEYPGNQRGVARARLDAYGVGLAVASVRAVGSHLVAERSELQALAKMREDEMNGYLAARPDEADAVLEVLPAEPFDSRCTFTENTEPPRRGFESHYETIDLTLRVYHDAVVVPGQVLSVGRVLTPDTFRHNQFRRLRNRHTIDLAPRFATLLPDVADLPCLPGTIFHLDNELRGHFGHLVTEQLSRFWGWSLARERYPDIRAVVAINKNRELREWESAIYAAGGIEPDNLVFLRQPVRVERIVSCTPMLSNPDYVHPAIVRTWREVGDRLEATSEPSPLPTRFFCSRRLAKRGCHNTEEVEAIFADHGFVVVYTEDYSLGDQVRLFRGAEVIAGFVGSALFSAMYALEPKRVIAIGSTAYTARNEYLIASVLGHTLDSIACVPDDPDFYQSAFTFDTEVDGAYLRTLLSSL